jgi:1-acyl-sn-glycerol-3-phosphate acyltransferase
MNSIRSLVFYLGYYGSLVPHAILCVLVGIFMPIRVRYHYFLLWNAFSLWWLKITCGITCQVAGRENVPPAPFVILANHQSPWETLFLYREFLPVCAILKKELLRIPFFGWALRLLHPIAIDRSRKGRSLQQLLEQGKVNLNNGYSVLVFPEGTRVNPGVEKKYSAGGAELAIGAGKLILPVAHNAGLYWPAHRFIKHPGIIKVVIGQPIDPAGRKARDVIQEVETWIRQAVKEDCG